MWWRGERGRFRNRNRVLKRIFTSSTGFQRGDVAFVARLERGRQRGQVFNRGSHHTVGVSDGEINIVWLVLYPTLSRN